MADFFSLAPERVEVTKRVQIPDWTRQEWQNKAESYGLKYEKSIPFSWPFFQRVFPWLFWQVVFWFLCVSLGLLTWVLLLLGECVSVLVLWYQVAHYFARLWLNVPIESRQGATCDVRRRRIYAGRWRLGILRLPLITHLHFRSLSTDVSVVDGSRLTMLKEYVCDE